MRNEWPVGAGVEHAFGRDLYGKVEYRYSNYSNADMHFGNGATSQLFDVDTDRHQVAVGLGMRF